MASVELIHLVFPEKTGAQRLRVALEDIRQNQRQAADYGNSGHGVYAYFADRVPGKYQGVPGVVFEVDAAMVKAEGRLSTGTPSSACLSISRGLE
jgi:hypothetical protein